MKVFKKNLHRRLRISFLHGLFFALGTISLSLFAVAVTGTINTFTSGQVIRASDINTNFATLKATIESIDATIPAGTIVAYGGTVAPTGWTICNGSTLSRTTNAALFAAIGTNFGSGDGSTTFNLPDFRGRFLRGYDTGLGRDPNAASRTVSNPGGNSGNAVGSIQNDSYQGHFHYVTENNSGTQFRTIPVGIATGSTAIGITGALDITLASTNVSDGSNGTPRFSPETRPVNVYVNYIIKL